MALLWAVTPLDEDVVRQDLKQLVDAALLYQRGVGATAVYQFKHALISGRRLPVAAQEHTAAVPSADCPGVG